MDHSLYVEQPGEVLLVVILYVDDLIILANRVAKLKWLKSKLKKDFEINDPKELHYCLGVEFERNMEACTIIMIQQRYIGEVFKHFNIEECKRVRTPSHVNSKF